MSSESLSGERLRPAAGPPLRARLPLTRIKLAMTHVLYRTLKVVGCRDRQRIRRRGIVFDVDISEGIGLALHGGTVMAATGARVLTLDEFRAGRGLDRLDLIKIDTDGHELDVLRGASGTVRRFRPDVVFEMGLYLLEERGQRVGQFFDLFEALGYSLWNTRGGRAVTRDSYPREVPIRATTDVLARHRDRE